MENKEIETIIRDYFEAVDNQDLEKCTAYFDDDATIKFQTGVFQGKQAIREWHNDRFKAELRVLSINKIDVNKNRAEVDGVVTSKRLKAWKINKLSGKAVFYFENGKINKSEIGMRIYNPLEGW